MSPEDRISLTVLTPEKTLLETRVSKVELPGSKGRFMVLWNHEPLISSLEKGAVVYEAEGATERINIVGGFVEVCDNHIVVCTEV